MGLAVLERLPEPARSNKLLRRVLLHPTDSMQELAAIVNSHGPNVMVPLSLGAMSTMTLAASWDLSANKASSRLVRGTLAAVLPMTVIGFAELSPSKQDAVVALFGPTESTCQQLRDTAAHVCVFADHGPPPKLEGIVQTVDIDEECTEYEYSESSSK